MKNFLEIPDLNKKFKLLHYILLSHGEERIVQSMHIDNYGDMDYYYSPWGSHKPINFLPESLNVLLEYIIEGFKDEIYNIISTSDDCRDNIEFTYDTNDKTFTVTQYQSCMTTDQFSQETDIDNEELVEELKKLREEGFFNIRVDFSGGGDSGYLESDGYDGDKRASISAGLEDFLYRYLESSYGGWEINEGAQGYFEIDTTTHLVTLEIGLNGETDEKPVVLFEHKFDF